MTNYRRNFLAGGTFFFTVNLADRRLRLLTEHIDELRSAVREVRERHSLHHRCNGRAARPSSCGLDVARGRFEFWQSLAAYQVDVLAQPSS
jgi:hypothetical protein